MRYDKDLQGEGRWDIFPTSPFGCSKNSSAPLRPGVIPEHHFYGSVLRHNEADGKPRATQCPLLSHRARDALTLRFLVFVNRATVGQATGGNASDTSALKSEIKICHATECEGIF